MQKVASVTTGEEEQESEDGKPAVNVARIMTIKNRMYCFDFDNITKRTNLSSVQMPFSIGCCEIHTTNKINLMHRPQKD